MTSVTHESEVPKFGRPSSAPGGLTGDLPRQSSKVKPLQAKDDVTLVDLVRQAALLPAIEGEEPFVWWGWLGMSCNPSDVIPDGTVLERTATTEEWQAVLARGDGFHVCIDSRSTDTQVTVTATSRLLAEAVGVAVRRAVPDADASTDCLIDTASAPRPKARTIGQYL